MNHDSTIRRAPRYRPSFTLVELLVAIAIIGVMAGMVMFSLAGAQRDAKIVRTRGTIEKINNVILQEWEKFRYRAARIEIDSEMLRPDPSFGGQPAISAREGARLRMIVLRDLMRMEMPDRFSDVLYPPTAYKAALLTADGDGANDIPYYAGPVTLPYSGSPSNFPGTRVVPGKLNNYRAKLGLAGFGSPYTSGVAASHSTEGLRVAVETLYHIPYEPGEPELTAEQVLRHQGAEMLYQIVAAANYQGASALENFHASEIGDVDEDGLPEFLDAWGNPIRWLRWPSGFASPLNDISAPDAMDPLRTDWRWSNSQFSQKPWLLIPLIISAGPDGIFDIGFDQPDPVAYATHTWLGTNSPAHARGGLYYFPDPYVGSYDGDGNFIRSGLGNSIDENGDGTTDGAVDNVSNYQILLD